MEVSALQSAWRLLYFRAGQLPSLCSGAKTVDVMLKILLQLILLCSESLITHSLLCKSRSG